MKMWKYESIIINNLKIGDFIKGWQNVNLSLIRLVITLQYFVSLFTECCYIKNCAQIMQLWKVFTEEDQCKGCNYSFVFSVLWLSNLSEQSTRMRAIDRFILETLPYRMGEKQKNDKTILQSRIIYRNSLWGQGTVIRHI